MRIATHPAWMYKAGLQDWSSSMKVVLLMPGPDRESLPASGESKQPDMARARTARRTGPARARGRSRQSADEAEMTSDGTTPRGPGRGKANPLRPSVPIRRKAPADLAAVE